MIEYSPKIILSGPKPRSEGRRQEQKTNIGIAILTDYFGKRIYQANKLPIAERNVVVPNLKTTIGQNVF